MAIFDPLYSTESTPLNRSPKFVTGDYVSDAYSNAKFGACPSMGGEWMKYNLILYLCPFGELTYRSDRSTDFRKWWLKRRGFAQGCRTTADNRQTTM